MKQFFQIEIPVDLDASSYNRISPTVRFIENSFVEHLLDDSLLCKHYYCDEVQNYYEDILSGDAVGKFMQSNKPVIDYWEPGYFHFTLDAIVSQRFVDILNRAGVNSNEYFLKPIEITNNKSGLPYYLFFVPSQRNNKIVYPKSVFERWSTDADKMEIRTFSTEKELFNTDGSWNEGLRGFNLQHAVIRNELAHMDIIRICKWTFFSAHLLEVMHNKGIKTVGVLPEHYLIVEE